MNTRFKDKTADLCKKAAAFIFVYRFLIAFLLLLFCVLLELSGSSIGCWANYFDSGVQAHTLFGFTRPIRIDEWGTNTAMAISQCFNTTEKFPYFSNAVSRSPMDMFIVYGQPVRDIAAVFRPFQLGYLFFGAAKGLSFFWCARLIALFLVSFEFGRLITNDRRYFAFTAAVFITFAPIVQWWFAVNGTAELLIFSQLLILLVNAYMKTDSYKKRVLYMFAAVWAAGSFIIVFYPAWQIPLGHIMLGFTVWVISENLKTAKFCIKDAFILVSGFLLLLLSMSYIYFKSADTIKAVMNTVYPGERLELGGGCVKDMIKYVCSYLLPIKQVPETMGNNSEAAAFFDLFPAGHILAFWVILDGKKKDRLLIILLILSLFFGLWCIVPFGRTIAKLTLMYNVPPYRCIFAWGLVNVFILIRACAILPKGANRLPALAAAAVSALVITFVGHRFYGDYINGKYLCAAFIYIFFGIYLIFAVDKTLEKKLFLLYTLAVFAFSGALVNPIEKGAGVLTENALFQKIREINGSENGAWMVEGAEYPLGNLTMAAGVPSLGATNVYPDLEKWSLIDTNGKYMDIYNRYAHIEYVYEDIPECSFELIGADRIRVHINTLGLEALETKYIISKNALESYKDGDMFEKICESGGYNIYKTKF